MVQVNLIVNYSSRSDSGVDSRRKSDDGVDGSGEFDCGVDY